jgi:4'-phosphopantetheinyl transferase
MYRFYINCHRWRPTRDQWIYAIRCLPIDELNRIDQYVFQRDVKFTLVGQLLIRYLLTRVFHQKSSSFLIQRTEHNRPFIQSIRTFDFNLSHHHQLVCIAGTFDGRIGCDTMIYRTDKIRHDYRNLLRKKFTANENDFIMKNSRDENIRLSRFYRLWCLKESYLKWLGVGIAFQLLRLNFQIQTAEFGNNEIISDTKLEIDNQLIADNNIRFDEQIISLENNEQQIISLCLSMKNKCQSFVELTIDDILHGCTPFDENKEDDLIWWERFQMKKTNR